MNSVKHMRGWDDIVVDFDAKQEAGEAIDRAISNYMSLLTRIELPVVRGLEEFVNIGSLESST